MSWNFRSLMADVPPILAHIHSNSVNEGDKRKKFARIARVRLAMGKEVQKLVLRDLEVGCSHYPARRHGGSTDQNCR
jgi:hypothetical protein